MTITYVCSPFCTSLAKSFMKPISLVSQELSCRKQCWKLFRIWWLSSWRTMFETNMFRDIAADACWGNWPRLLCRLLSHNPAFNHTVQCHHTVGELEKCHKKLEQSQSLLLLTHVDGDRLGQRCRLAPSVDDNAGWTSADLMLPVQCVKASLDQFGRKTLELFIWQFYFADGSVNTKSPDFREVIWQFCHWVGTCGPEAFTATSPMLLQLITIIIWFLKHVVHVIT